MEKRNTTQSITRRSLQSPVELRAKDGAQLRMIGGYASVFDTTTNLGWMTESVAPGAFDDVLSNDVRCLFNHDPNQILGRTVSGTCRIAQDEKGLMYECDMSESSPIAQHVMDAISRGDVSQSSFAFTIKEEKWEKKKNDQGFEYWHRTILKVGQLYDVSPVTYPAYEDATVEELSRSLEMYVEQNIPAEVDAVRQLRSKLLGLTEEPPVVEADNTAAEVLERKVNFYKKYFNVNP